MVDAVFQSGLEGLQTGLNRLKTNAHNIATAIGDKPSDITSSLVDFKIGQRQVESSVAVIKVADEILGTLLDEFA